MLGAKVEINLGKIKRFKCTLFDSAFETNMSKTSNKCAPATKSIWPCVVRKIAEELAISYHK